MRRVAWALLLVFAFTIPWEYSLDLGAPLGNIARIAGLVLLLAFIPAVLQAGRFRAFGLMQCLVAALYLWFCCSYFWTIDAAATLERMRGFAQVMITVVLVWELAETPDDLCHLMRAWVAGSWVLVALTLANFVSPATAGQIRFAAEGQDPNDVARFLDLGFPMAALLLHSDRRWWARTLALGYLPLGLIGVLLTASRGGLLAASVAIAGTGLLLIRSHRRLLVGASLALPLLVAIFWLAVPRATVARIATIPEQLSGGDLNQRLNIWATGSQAFAHAPLFGAGAGTFVAAARLARIDTAHNTALSIAVEGGLIALALALAIVVAATHAVLRTRGPVRVALGTALLVWMVTSLVATVEGNRSTWFLLALISVAGRFALEAPEAMSRQFDVAASRGWRPQVAEPTA
jgi:O-antigen ligase